MAKFEVGQTVEWSSQAGGSTKTKRGVVVIIVPPNDDVNDFFDDEAEPEYNKCFDGGWPRDHESYLIAVPNKSGRGKPKLYWPRVSALRLAESASDRQENNND